MCCCASRSSHPPKEHELALALAAWFHDAVYQPDRDDNEERSAYAAYDALEQVGASPELMAEVVRLIRLTAGHSADDDDIAGAVLCDADLSILGAPREKYVQYAQAIRQEYIHVPVAAVPHRTAEASARPSLNASTSTGRRTRREHWEARARENIEAEIACFDPPPIVSRPRHRWEPCQKHIVGLSMVCFDANDPPSLAAFWAALLGGERASSTATAMPGSSWRPVPASTSSTSPRPSPEEPTAPRHPRHRRRGRHSRGTRTRSYPSRRCLRRRPLAGAPRPRGQRVLPVAAHLL